ncbi:uncharacterized protein LOC131146540 isoform X1 [Malania oleifera]|uniref:uncharacterized protein LOC131146540 isoform X1 n=1 Tax=Malania oleifera TaxID=397392 RepID=UPI0025AEACCC|nr:uncharacterized protein LOC131146540 isoform X1 [Malania oleifera]
MAIVTGDRYLESLVKFVEQEAGPLIEGTLVLKLNPVGLHYVHSRLEALQELESLLAGAPVDYLRAYVSDLGDHRALEQLRRILRLLTSLKVVSVLAAPARDPTPLSLLPFGRLRLLELRGCDLSTSAARGLLELRHTLEKLICHNSTDALRHVFAGRIAEIEDSPQWKRLSFVSCACNGVVVMDESLQLLPVVETLDLSRNKFAKVDNLRKCTKLKHLDLGFNHLRTIASFSEVSCHIVKLVLRNNALATLHGIQNLKSLEGLDLSYNVISKFSELEILKDLPSIQCLWLEGNPLCCARWYRAQVFSFFTHPHKLRLDEKGISMREFWKRQIIIASRQKRPASFGFYSPAQDDAEAEGSINIKRKKLSRLVCIESEQGPYICSDHESVSCDNEIRSGGEKVISDDEAEIADLMNRVELMKKERSVLWLREFKEWMDPVSENFLDSSKYDGASLSCEKNYIKDTTTKRNFGESSKFVSDGIHASGDESSTNILESENSFADVSVGLCIHQFFDQVGEAGSLGDASNNPVLLSQRMDLNQEHLKSNRLEGVNCISVESKNSNPDAVIVRGHGMGANVGITSMTVIDDIMESHSSSGCPGSPPHYQEDILQRRHNLVEEILQLSAESFSVRSSDSNTSDSDDDLCECETLITEDVLTSRVDGCLHVSPFEDAYYDQRNDAAEERSNGRGFLNSHDVQASSSPKLLKLDHSMQLCSNDFPPGGGGGGAEVAHSVSVNLGSNWTEKKKCRWRPKRRVILLSEENNIISKTETSQNVSGNLNVSRYNEKYEPRKQIFDASDFAVIHDEKRTQADAIAGSCSHDTHEILSGVKQSSLEIDDFIEDYFNTNLADSRVHETCTQYMCCGCILELESKCKEREVAVLVSSEQKLYVLLIDATLDGSGIALKAMDCHKVEEVREVLIALGLQVVRVYIAGGATYLFITRGIEKSRELLCTLQVSDSSSDKCVLRSLEQVQVELFEKLICGGLRMSMFQYSLVHFWSNREKSWLSRSLFVIGVDLALCIEDFKQLDSLSLHTSSSPYFLLDSCCSITDVSEMVIEIEGCSVTLALECARSEFCCTANTQMFKDVAGLDNQKVASGSLTWKLRWSSEESLLKFLMLLKAIHAGTAMSPLLVRCIS